MIFGKNNGQQNRQDARSAAPEAGSAQPVSSPWPNAGGAPLAGSYPSQPSGTGYAGYQPAGAAATGNYGQQAGGVPGGGGYAQNYSQPYAQSGAWPQQRQNGYSLPQQGQGGYAGSGAGAYEQNGNGQGAPYPNQQAYTGAAYAAPGRQAFSNPQPYAGAGYAAQGQRDQEAGYGGQNNGGYAGQGYATWPQMQPGQGSPQGNGGYTWPQMQPGQGSPQGNGGYTYPQMQPGQNPQGYAYPPYAQMGRNQQPQQGGQGGSQIPLNGGGYIPQPAPVKKQPFVFNDGLLILMSAVLLVLFAVGLFVPGLKMLLWPFLALAAGSIGFFWMKPLVSGNRRKCYTIIFGALSLVALMSATGMLAGIQSRRTETAKEAQAAQENQNTLNGTGSQGGSNLANGGGAVVDPETGNVISAVNPPQNTPSPTPEAEEDTATKRLESFFRFWSAGMQDEMLTLCSPSWQSSVDNPKTALFGLLANRRPMDYTVEKISGVAEDTSRTVTVTSTIDRNNGKDPVKYRLSVLMTKEGETWYVDPQSLKTYEQAETPDPATAATPTPTQEPATSGSTILYYNPDGGAKYHLDANCKSIHAKYLPLKGHFTYAEINDEKYKELQPCNVCAAPLR